MFFVFHCQSLISGSKTGCYVISLPKPEMFLTFPNFLTKLTLTCLVACEETCLPSLLYYRASVLLLVVIQTCTKFLKKHQNIKTGIVDTVTEQTVFNFLLIIICPHSTTKFGRLVKYLILLWKMKLSVFSIQGPLDTNKII